MTRFLTRRAFGGIGLGLAASCVPAFAAEPALLYAAKQEGRLVWYTTLVVGQIVRPIINAFEAKYPGITVDFMPAEANRLEGNIVFACFLGAMNRYQVDIGDAILQAHTGAGARQKVGDRVTLYFSFRDAVVLAE